MAALARKGLAALARNCFAAPGKRWFGNVRRRQKTDQRRRRVMVLLPSFPNPQKKQIGCRGFGGKRRRAENTKDSGGKSSSAGTQYAARGRCGNGK